MGIVGPIPPLSNDHHKMVPDHLHRNYDKIPHLFYISFFD